MSEGQWKNRIVGTDEVPPEQLLANPMNFRRHSRDQQDAMAAILEDVGWVSEVIVNQETGHVVDGHMRVELAMRQGAPTVPVRYVRLTQEEESKILATFDPISGMAFVDKDALRDLLGEVPDVDDDRMTTLFGKLSREAAPPTDTDWLDDYRAGGDGSSGDGGADESRPRNDSEKSDAVVLTFAVLNDERADVLAAINRAKDDAGVETGGDALVHMARTYLEG